MRRRPARRRQLDDRRRRHRPQRAHRGGDSAAPAFACTQSRRGGAAKSHEETRRRSSMSRRRSCRHGRTAGASLRLIVGTYGAAGADAHFSPTFLCRRGVQAGRQDRCLARACRAGRLYRRRRCRHWAIVCWAWVTSPVLKPAQPAEIRGAAPPAPGDAAGWRTDDGPCHIWVELRVVEQGAPSRKRRPTGATAASPGPGDPEFLPLPISDKISPHAVGRCPEAEGS